MLSKCSLFLPISMKGDNWAMTWQDKQYECAPSEDSDQPGHPPSLTSLRCPHEENLGPELPIERTAKTLVRLGRCPGWSESSLGAYSFCWFCHFVGQLTESFLSSFFSEPPDPPFLSCCSLSLCFFDFRFFFFIFGSDGAFISGSDSLSLSLELNRTRSIG